MKTALALALLLLVAAEPALAHGPADALGSGATWTYDPWVVVPLYLSATLYLVGTLRLWRRAGTGRGVRQWQAACFWSGWTLTALALISPLHWLGERLFVAHMSEHELLMVVAAPLLALSRPVGAFLWALPPAWRSALGRAAQARAVARSWRVLREPLVATLVHGVAVWIWHMPALYSSVLQDVTMHRLQHVSFFFTAVLFWYALFYGPQRHRGYGIAVFCLFVTALHTSLLGILITLARRLWYPAQVEFAAFCGLTPLEDQQLAGLVMWIPPGLIYTAVALFFAARWIARSGAELRSRGYGHVVAFR